MSTKRRPIVIIGYGYQTTYGEVITDVVALSLQQRSYPRMSLKRQEPAAGGTGEWTWQSRLSPPAVPAAVTNPALPAHPLLPPPQTTSGHLAPWLPDVRPDRQPHFPGIAKRLCIAAFLIPFFLLMFCLFLFSFFFFSFLLFLRSVYQYNGCMYHYNS